MLTERTIINGLIIAVSFILVPFVISQSLSLGNFLPALFVVGALALVIAFFFIKEKLSVMPILGSFFGGTLNFLPMHLGMSQISSMLLIAYFVTGYVLIRQRKIKVGRRVFLFPLLIVTGIIFYHVHTLSFGALGGETEGARPAYFIYLMVIAYFCGINLPTPSVSFLSKMPMWALIVTGVASVPYLLSTYIPALAPYLYSVTDSVNVEAYINTQGGTEEAGGELSSKLAVFGPLGMTLQAYLLAHYPIGTWFSPSRLGVLCLSFVCLILTICCGYRSDFFGYILLIVIGAWCYYSWRALVVPTALGVGLLLFVSASSNGIIDLPVNKLPMIAQRTMSFLPGDWDKSALESAKSSDEFRKGIINVYLEEYATRSPVFGNGFDINVAEFEYYDAIMDRGGGSDPVYNQAKLFCEGKMFHTGWISVYDNVGLVGSIGFIAMQLGVIFAAGHFVFGAKADKRSTLYPTYVWTFCYVTTATLSFYSVFGNFADAFNGLIIYAILLSHLHDLENTTDLPVPHGELKKSTDFSGLTGAGYGERYGYGGYYGK